MFLVVQSGVQKYSVIFMFHVLDGVRLLPSQNLIGNTSGEEDIKKTYQNGL